MDGQQGRGTFFTLSPYTPPSWATNLDPIPSHSYTLGHLPTPIHRWDLPGLPANTEVWIKRDDLSGMQLSGNKVRKLEFLMADAKAQGADCVITIGGIQSNHCRATAVAARYLNLDCYLILRTTRAQVDEDPGLTGNLLVERMVGANIELVSMEEHAQIGSVTLCNVLKERLLKEGRKPYVIPVGGSNSLGTWGYIDAIREIEQQLQEGKVVGINKFDDVVAACGSGGTTAGLSLGSHLSSLKAKVHAFSVCVDPDYFYDYTQCLLDGLHAGVNSRDLLSIVNAKGLGYAMSKIEELKFVCEIAESTGVVLDPVYRGYIEAIREIQQQLQEGEIVGINKFDDVVVACGSGGTTAGLSLGSHLSSLKAKVHAFSVCDDPDYFYDYTQGLLDGLHAGVNSRDLISIVNARGLGYAMSKIEELKFVCEIAESTGVVLDPVYSGKAAFQMLKDMVENPSKWEGRRVLFIHSGGLLGMFDKVQQLQPLIGKWQRFKVDDSILHADGLGKMF